MKFETKIRKLSQELDKKGLGTVANVKKTLEKLHKIQSFGLKLIPSEGNALALIGLTHGHEEVEKLIKTKSLLNKVLVNTFNEKLNQLLQNYKEVRVNLFHKKLTDLMTSEGVLISNEIIEDLVNSLKITKKEKELTFSNLKLSNREGKLYSNHSKHIKELLILFNLSFTGNNQDILAKTISKLSTLNIEDIGNIEADINVEIAQKLKSFMKDITERKEINKTKFLKILDKKKKKLVFNVDFYNTHTLLEQKKVISINAKYLILEDNSKVLINKSKGIDLKFYDDRVELHKNNILLSSSYIIKPVLLEKSLNEFLGFNTTIVRETDKEKVENQFAKENKEELTHE